MGTEGCDSKGDWQCRICAAVISQNNAIHIFAEDGRRHYLQTKIRKYLYIVVSSEDKLPKAVCSTCIKKLEGVHHFATMAYKTQERLKLQACETSDCAHPVKDVDIKDVESDKDRNNEDRSLSHPVITKDSVEVLTECDSLGSSEGETKDVLSNTEEMEVKVDPMLFLQCGMEQSTSETSDLSEDDDDDDEGSKLREYFPESLPLITEIEDDKLENEKDSKDSKHHDVWTNDREKRFVGKSSNVLHVNADNSVGNFVCPICNKRISTKGNLKVHLETHRPKGKYGCDICGRIFKTQSNLFRHKEYHGGVQYPCNVCGRVYPTNSTLRAHSITHSDLRPHACPLCDKTFKRNQDLKFHINQHTGARPYQCPYCPKAFASSGNCFSHRKRMHPREVHRDRQIAADLMR